MSADASSSSSKPSKPPLPPGMVLGPDGKPCKICTAFRNWKPKTEGSPTQQQHTPASGQQKTAAMMAAFASGTGFAASSSSSQTSTPTPTPIPEPEPVRPADCPPNVEQLGRATWTFLHTTAAYYPERPSAAQRVNMLSLLRALPVLYPCSHCAQHLGKNMDARPPDVSGRGALSRWLCEQHNEVNERLGKARFECTPERLDERWKDGPADGRCD